MKFKPLHDRILVKRLENDEKSKGGIIIPDSAKEKPSEGEIVAVGPGALNTDGKRNPIDVKVGDKVLFSKYSGDEVKIDGQDLIIIKEEDRFMDTDYYKNPKCHIYYSLLFDDERDITINALVEFEHEDDSYSLSLEDKSMIVINNEDKKVLIDKIMYAKQNNMKVIQVL